MKVVAINPTKEKLEEMGYKPQNDPIYLTTENDGPNGEKVVKKLRLDFHLIGQSPGGDKIMTKVAFFLEDQFRVNKDGTKSRIFLNIRIYNTQLPLKKFQFCTE